MSTPEKTPLDLPMAADKKRRAEGGPAGTNAPTTIAEGRERMKRRRLSGQERKDIVDMARGITGYDSSSPIWGKRMPVVLTEIGTHLEEALKSLDSNKIQTGAEILNAKDLVTELAKRIATGQIIGSNS